MADDVVQRLRITWSGTVDLTEDLYVPAAGIVNVTDWRGYDLQLKIALVDGRYRCSELHMFQREDGAEVTGEALRGVPVAGIMQRAVTQVATEDMPKITKQLDGRTPTTETLRSVAWVYQLAQVIGDAPKQRVATEFDIATSTAGRWIARARDARLLPPVGKRGD